MARGLLHAGWCVVSKFREVSALTRECKLLIIDYYCSNYTNYYIYYNNLITTKTDNKQYQNTSCYSITNCHSTLQPHQIIYIAARGRS